MSRMLAFTAETPVTMQDAIGTRTLADFAGLAALHGDGRGRSGIDGDGRTHRSVEIATSAAATAWAQDPRRLRRGAVYLRFASAGSTVAPENVQPFARAGVTFCHNGALVPADRAPGLLTDAERAGLIGSTDSEVYFARVLRALRDARGGDEGLLSAVATGVAAVREAFPDACLNAYLLHPRGLVVIHSAGSRPTPLAAFRARGFDVDDLPPGHDDGYNRLWCRRRDDVFTVATTGIDLTGWEPLPADTVTLLGDSGPRHVALG